jgi:hypothetical protein
MDKETLRMQMLAGVITEGQYKEKLEEIGIGAVLGGAAVAALAKKAYGAYKNYALKKGMKETGNEKKGTNGIIAKEYMSEKDGKTYWGITYEDNTRDSGYEKPRMFLFTPEKIDKVLNSDIQFATSDEDSMADGAEKKLGQFIADKVVMLEGKNSLNEHYVAGGIVGIGAINQIPSRAKADYEDAFEYFLSQKYSINEEMEDEMVDSNMLKSYLDELISLADDMEYTPEMADELENLKNTIQGGKISVENALDLMQQTIDITGDEIGAVEALGQAVDFDPAIIDKAREISGLIKKN